jgi:hypothetical protein
MPGWPVLGAALVLVVGGGALTLTGLTVPAAAGAVLIAAGVVLAIGLTAVAPGQARVVQIAQAMLRRQQAGAIIAARRQIVDGAVGMVESALTRLTENDVIELDEERKAAMVSNLLVVLCGDRDAQPVVNTGSLYQ